MALTYDLTAIKNLTKTYPHRVTSDGETAMNNITNMLIFVSMITGIREITSQNAHEVFTRIRMSEMIHGGYFLDEETGGYRHVTLQEVTDHIGLKTNASDISKAQFNGYMNRQMREKIDREVS
tara:strand:- start:45 stop:413 length:369 start_codon:yes stop_codon:yes gene_type:complete